MYGRRLATDSPLFRSLAQCSRYWVPVLVPPPWFPIRYGWIQMILLRDDRGPCACDSSDLFSNVSVGDFSGSPISVSAQNTHPK